MDEALLHRGDKTCAFERVLWLDLIWRCKRLIAGVCAADHGIGYDLVIMSWVWPLYDVRAIYCGRHLRGCV